MKVWRVESIHGFGGSTRYVIMNAGNAPSIVSADKRSAPLHFILPEEAQEIADRLNASDIR